MSSKQKAATTATGAKGADGVGDYRQEHEEFKDNISELFYQNVVRLMDDLEERRREEEQIEIGKQLATHKLRKQLTKKDKHATDNELGRHKAESSTNTSPAP